MCAKSRHYVGAYVPATTRRRIDAHPRAQRTVRAFKTPPSHCSRHRRALYHRAFVRIVSSAPLQRRTRVRAFAARGMEQRRDEQLRVRLGCVRVRVRAVRRCAGSWAVSMWGARVGDVRTVGALRSRVCIEQVGVLGRWRCHGHLAERRALSQTTGSVSTPEGVNGGVGCAASRETYWSTGGSETRRGRGLEPKSACICYGRQTTSMQRCRHGT